MIKLLYFCYNFNAESTSLVGKYLAKIARKLTSILTVLILPAYFYFIRLYVLPRINKKGNGIIITLTSFPARIAKLYQVIISLMLQTSQANEIVLYLSKEQFKSIEDLPKSLKLLIPYGLKVILVEDDMRSYKKYIYNKDFFGDLGFIIVDDDVIYHPDTIDILLRTGKKYPKNVCANRCVIMESDKKYQDWKLANIEGIGSYMATGCAGVFYPAGSLNEMAYNKRDAWENCPDGDDIWLKASTTIAKAEVVYTGFNNLLLPILNDNANDLHVKNVEGMRNDININRVKEFLNKTYNKELFN